MTFLFTLISFLIIVALAACLAGLFKLPAGAAPFTAVCVCMVWLSVFGCLGLLQLGGYLLAAAAAAGVLVLWRRRGLRVCIDGGFLFFAASGFLLLVLFAVKQPLYLTWDEFSFWGTAVKLTKTAKELFVTAEIGWPWAATQKPGLVLLGWFANFFGEYTEWRAIFGMDLAALSVMAAVVSLTQGKKAYLPVFAVGVAFFVPYLCTVYSPSAVPSNVYMNILADVPMAWLFAGTLILYFVLRIRGQALWPAALSLAALILTKDTALALALIAAGLMSVDLLFCGRQAAFCRLSGIRAKWCRIASFFAVPVATFLGWAFYLKLALGVNALGDVGGTETMGMKQMLLSGVSQLLGIGTTEKFADRMGRLYAAFFTSRVSMFGSGFVLVIIILLMLLFAALFAENRAGRVRCGLFALFSTLGFFANYTFIGFSYVFVFKDIEAVNLVGYERYIYPYYIAWFIVAAALLGFSAQHGIKKHFYGVGSLALAGVFAVCFLRVASFISPDMSFVGYHNGYQQHRRDSLQAAKQVREIVTEKNARVFYICQGDDGSGWFTTSYELLPLQLDYSYGGGTFSLPELVSADTPYSIGLTAEQMCGYIQKNGCDYVYVAKSNELLALSYGELFSDRLAACAEGGAVYKVESTQTGLRFELAEEVRT